MQIMSMNKKDLKVKNNAKIQKNKKIEIKILQILNKETITKRK